MKNMNVIQDPIQEANKKIMQCTPYNIEQIFTQICEYKVFLVNLKRAVLLGDKNFFKRVFLINSDWFNKWKKISCYEAIKDELNMCNDIPTNYKNNINSYIEILNNLQITDTLDKNIDNNSIKREFKDNEVQILPESNFDIISPELWQSFNKIMNNPNNGTEIEKKIEYITKDSIEIPLGKTSSYIIFWNLNEQRLGRIIFKFKGEMDKYYAFENVKSMGINNYYACYLEDLFLTKPIKGQNYYLVCINKSEFKKYVNANSEGTNNSNTNSNNTSNINTVNNLGPMGLENIFLTCYTNSSLQSLVNVDKLSNYFSITDFDEYKQILSFAYRKVVLNLLRLTTESQNLTVYKPQEFFGMTQAISPLFREMAGDANDLINFFLEQIHTELNKYMINENVFANYYVQNAGNNIKFYNLNAAITDYYNKNNSIISNLFYFITKSKTQCLNCNRINYNFQFYRTLVFPLEDIRQKKSQEFNTYLDSINLMDGFDHFQRKVPLINDNMMYCNNCQGKTNGLQYDSLYSSPEYLIINLNRGKGKIYNIKVYLEEFIDLNNYVESKVYNNKYRLISIIKHFGQSGTAGHYIAFCYVEREEDWFKFNDALVERSSFKEGADINNGDSYVLIYKRTGN